MYDLSACFYSKLTDLGYNERTMIKVLCLGIPYFRFDMIAAGIFDGLRFRWPLGPETARQAQNSSRPLVVWIGLGD